MKSQYINSVKAIECFILLLLFIQMGMLFVNNKLQLFINPKFTILLFVSAFCILIFVLYLIGQMFNSAEFSGSLFNSKYLFLILMIVLISLPSYSDYQENISRLRGVSVGENIMYKDSAYVNVNNPSPDKAGQSTETGTQKSKKETVALSAKPKQVKAVDVRSDFMFTDKNYVGLMCNIYDEPDNSKGKTVSIKGFVYRLKGMDKNQFVIARLFMMCCAADASILGILCQVPESDHHFKDNDWYIINGVLDLKKMKIHSKHKIVPVVQVKEYHKAKEEKSPYVYQIAN